MSQVWVELSSDEALTSIRTDCYGVLDVEKVYLLVKCTSSSLSFQSLSDLLSCNNCSSSLTHLIYRSATLYPFAKQNFASWEWDHQWNSCRKRQWIIPIILRKPSDQDGESLNYVSKNLKLTTIKKMSEIFSYFTKTM